MLSSASRPAVLALLSIMACATPSSGVAAQAEPAPPPVDPSAPMDEMPDLGVGWPDLSIPQPDETVAQPSTVDLPQPAAEPDRTLVDVETERRYTMVVEGLDMAEAATVRARFASLSMLNAGEKNSANTAQVDRRAREDEALLRELLRAEGYYAASVATRVEDAGGRLSVILAVDPGPLFTFSEVVVDGLEAAGPEAVAARSAFTIAVGDPVNADKVQAATANLGKRLADRGYPFAKVPDPDITVDHADHLGTLALSVDPGTYAHFGAIKLSGHPPFGARHIARIARFKRGDVYNAADIEDLRRALIATGLVSSVALTPQATENPEVVDVDIAIEPAPMRTIAGELGYGTGEGIRAAVSWTHRNLLRPEGAVTFRAVAGTREQYLGASLRRGNFRRRDQVLAAQVAASHVNRNAYDARTFIVSAGIERQTNIIWQKKWTWSIGPELVASDERDTVAATGLSRRRTFYIGAFPGSLAYDGTDDLLDPKRGFRLSGRLSPELSFHSGSFGYARAQIDASGYFPVGRGIVLAGRTRVGTIAGAQRDQIAPSRRFYSGGGGSVRGYGYQDIGPRDVDNDPIGGRSIAEFSLEARIRFGDFGVVPFIDGGNIYTEPLPRFTGLRYGAGLGVRYYTSFGPIRVDVGTPVNRRSGDPRVAVYVSLGQAF